MGVFTNALEKLIKKKFKNTGEMHTDVVSERLIKQELADFNFFPDVESYKTLDSTNNFLKRYAERGIVTDTVVIAESQTAGRGRIGRSFYSPDGMGIYFSIILHPKKQIIKCTDITTMAAVAEVLAIESALKISPCIKWVNDIYFGNKKVSGILAESKLNADTDVPEYVILGVGINIYTPEKGFPEDIKDVAGALLPDNNEIPNLKNSLVSGFLINFLKFYNNLPDKSYMDIYREKCFCIGKDVTVINSDHTEITGVALDRTHAHVLGVNDDGNLRVRYGDGYEEDLSSGEISIKL